MAEDKSKGLESSLWLLTLWLILIQPLAIVGEFRNAYIHPSNEYLKMLESPKGALWVMMQMGAFIIFGLFGIYSGWILSRRGTGVTRRKVITCLWIVWPGKMLVLFLLIPYFIGFVIDFDHLLASVLSSSLWALAWSLYIGLSKDVRSVFDNHRAKISPYRKTLRSWHIAKMGWMMAVENESAHLDRQPISTSKATEDNTIISPDGVQKYNFEINTEKAYQQVAEELERGDIDKGLWAYCFSEREGDELKTKSLYIKMRVELLMQATATHTPIQATGNISAPVPKWLNKPTKTHAPDFYQKSNAQRRKKHFLYVGILATVFAIACLLIIIRFKSVPEKVKNPIARSEEMANRWSDQPWLHSDPIVEDPVIEGSAKTAEIRQKARTANEPWLNDPIVEGAVDASAPVAAPASKGEPMPWDNLPAEGIAVDYDPFADTKTPNVYQAPAKSEDYKFVENPLWMKEMSARLASRVPDKYIRTHLLSKINYEAHRAGIDPQVVLAIIDASSGFNRYAVEEDGRRGIMGINPSWIKEIGHPGDNLLDLNTNLRYGCTIFRADLDYYNGDLSKSLIQYRFGFDSSEFKRKVLALLAGTWKYPS